MLEECFNSKIEKYKTADDVSQWLQVKCRRQKGHAVLSPSY